MNCIRLLRLSDKMSFSLSKISSARYVSHHSLRFLETQNMWREKDGVSKRWQLIYKAPMSTALNFASTYVTITTGIIGASTIYYGAFVYDAADKDPVIIGDDVVIANTPMEGLVYLGGFIALHIAVKLLLSKYVIRLYKDGDEYLAIFRGHLYNSIKTHKFNIKDFEKTNLSIVIPWSESRYRLGSKQGILLDNYFKSPEYLNDLLNKNKKVTAEEEE